MNINHTKNCLYNWDSYTKFEDCFYIFLCISLSYLYCDHSRTMDLMHKYSESNISLFISPVFINSQFLMERGMCKLNRLESPLQNIGPDLPYKKMDNLCAKVHIY